MLPKNLFKNGFTINEDTDGEPIDVPSLETVRNFIRDSLRKIKTINTKIGSLKLKHIAENYIGVNKISVANGDLIASMILEGYKYRRDGKNSPNANFNLSQLSVRKFLER